MNLIKKIRYFICSEVLGHSFSDTDKLVFKIKTNDLNNDMSATLKCKVCGEYFCHKDSVIYETYQEEK